MDRSHARRIAAPPIAAALSLAVFAASAAAGVTLTPTLLEPSAASRTSSPVKVRFVLPENAAPSSVTVTFQGGATLVLDSTMQSKGVHELLVNTGAPLTSTHVTSVIPSGGKIPDGTYKVVISYSDEAADPAAGASVEGVVVDTVTQPPSLIGPTAGSEQTGPFNVVFSLPEEGEVAIPGSLQVLFTGAATSTLALSTVFPGEHSVSIDPANLAQAGTVTAGAAALPNGGYTLRVGYRDILGNPEAFSGSTAFKLNVPAPKTEPAPSQPAATTSASAPAPVLAPVASGPLEPKLLPVRWRAVARTLTATFVPVAGAHSYKLTLKLGRTVRTGRCRVLTKHGRRSVACTARVPAKGRWSATASALGSAGTLALAAKTVRFR